LNSKSASFAASSFANFGLSGKLDAGFPRTIQSNREWRGGFDSDKARKSSGIICSPAMIWPARRQAASLDIIHSQPRGLSFFVRVAQTASSGLFQLAAPLCMKGRTNVGSTSNSLHGSSFGRRPDPAYRPHQGSRYSRGAIVPRETLALGLSPSLATQRFRGRGAGRHANDRAIFRRQLVSRTSLLLRSTAWLILLWQRAGRDLRQILEHDPEKACPHLMRGGHRFSIATNAERVRAEIMLKR
jgi:hypothetical protein